MKIGSVTDSQKKRRDAAMRFLTAMKKQSVAKSSQSKQALLSQLCSAVVSETEFATSESIRDEIEYHDDAHESTESIKLPKVIPASPKFSGVMI